MSETVEPVVVEFEQMILEAVVEDHEVALRGLLFAYEMALHMRYPFKVRRP